LNVEDAMAQARAELNKAHAARAGRDFVSLMSLRSQADYNRHFVMDAEGLADELAKADALFESLGKLLAERGVEADDQSS